MSNFQISSSFINIYGDINFQNGIFIQAGNIDGVHNGNEHVHDHNQPPTPTQESDEEPMDFTEYGEIFGSSGN